MSPDSLRDRVRKLRDLKLSSVDLVPKGSNPGARIMLFKQEEADQLSISDEALGARGYRRVVKKSAHERADEAYGLVKEFARDLVVKGEYPTAEIAAVAILDADPDIRKEVYAVEIEQQETRERANRRPSKRGEYVSVARKERGLTQAQLAGHAGLDQTTISKLESGEIQDLTFENFSRVLAALDTDFVTLQKANIL